MKSDRRAQWQLDTARAQFGELIDAALRGEPQCIMRANNDAVIAISEQAYVVLKASAKQNAPDFVSYLLAIPKRKRPRASRP